MASNPSKSSAAKSAKEAYRTRQFDDEDAKARYALFADKRAVTPRNVDHAFFKNSRLRTFDLMRGAGLGCIIDLDEVIYPSLMKEFYTHLKLKETEKGIEGEVFLRGARWRISEKILAKLLGFKEKDENKVRLYDYVGDFKYEGYAKTRAVKMLTGGGGNENFALHLLDEDTRLLHHAVSQLLVPKTHKTNPANTREIFYMWCIRSGLILDVPYIIMSHLKAFMNNEFSEMPFGMIITKIAQHLEVDLKGIPFDKPTAQGSYGSNMLSHLKSKKYLDPVEKEESDEEPPSKKQKRKQSNSKGKGKAKRAVSPARRSNRLALEAMKEGPKGSVHIDLSREQADSSEEDPMDMDELPKPTFDEEVPEKEPEKEESSSLPKPCYSHTSSADKDEVNTDEIVKIAMNVGVGTSGANKDTGKKKDKEPAEQMEKEPVPMDRIFEGTSGKITPEQEVLLRDLLQYCQDSLPPSAVKVLVDLTLKIEALNERMIETNKLLSAFVQEGKDAAGYRKQKDAEDAERAKEFMRLGQQVLQLLKSPITITNVNNPSTSERSPPAPYHTPPPSPSDLSLRHYQSSEP